MTEAIDFNRIVGAYYTRYGTDQFAVYGIDGFTGTGMFLKCFDTPHEASAYTSTVREVIQLHRRLTQ